MALGLQDLCVFGTERKELGSRWWWYIHTGLFRSMFVLILMLTLPASWASDALQVSDAEMLSDYQAVLNYTYRDAVTGQQMSETEKGKYGTKSLVEERTGKGVHVRGKDGKSHGCDEYGITLPTVPWIALIERGECIFTNKIERATHTYNATAVIIYNNEGQDMTIMEHEVDDQVSISVSREVGKMLADLADRGSLLEITIIPDKKEIARDVSSHNSISKTSVLFVSISFIVLMIISLAWLVFYYIQRFRYAHAKERLARRLASAAKKAIAKIPQKSVKSGDRELDSEFDQCAICIEGYKPYDVIRILPCRHVFHKSCVDPWLLDQRSCPICKLDILRAFGMQVMGSSQDSVHQDAESVHMVTTVEEQEPSSAMDEQVRTDTEVKVLLLPHSCLHFHPDPQSTSDPGTGAGTSSQDMNHSPSLDVVTCGDSDGGLSGDSEDCERQALMGLHGEKVGEGEGKGDLTVTHSEDCSAEDGGCV